KNEKLRLNSTSGGIYGELARYILEIGGYIAGVIFDDNFVAKHIVSNAKADYDKIIGSKYFQSDTNGVYNKIKNLLIDGQTVLFCGNPCQSAALLSYLDKDYQNLYTCDFICRGNLSPKAFKKYKEMLEKQYNSPLKELHFKNKTIGWNDFGTKAIFENGEEYFKGRNEDLYIKSYIHYNLFLRPSCLECQFKKMPRVSDITFGDYWDVAENVDKSLDDNKGTSVVLINSAKGQYLFDSIKKDINYTLTTIEQVHKGNACLLASAKKGEKRDVVFANIDNYDFDVLINKFTKESILSIIKGKLRGVLGKWT
ncbi:MAG: Coenzyme F420 hydrogenase/dehydrogenase, beta subunit C-terminal domain, partial [Oscillospiraceae bacterium]